MVYVIQRISDEYMGTASVVDSTHGIVQLPVAPYPHPKETISRLFQIARTRASVWDMSVQLRNHDTGRETQTDHRYIQKQRNSFEVRI